VLCRSQEAVRVESGRERLTGALRLTITRSTVLQSYQGQSKADDTLDWREGPDDDLVLALAIAAWEAERNPGLGFSFSYGVSVFGGLSRF